MRPGWKWMAAMSVLVLGIVVSVSGAATSGSKRDGGGSSGTQSEKRQAKDGCMSSARPVSISPRSPTSSA